MQRIEKTLEAESGNFQVYAYPSQTIRGRRGSLPSVFRRAGIVIQMEIGLKTYISAKNHTCVATFGSISST